MSSADQVPANDFGGSVNDLNDYGDPIWLVVNWEAGGRYELWVDGKLSRVGDDAAVDYSEYAADKS